MSRNLQNWLFALILTAPMVMLYFSHYLNHSPSLIPTGFITYDNVSYVAYAKEYIDKGQFSVFYANPLNDSANYQAIYFQPQTLILAFLLWLGFAPGFTIVLANFLGTVFSFRTAIAIYDHLYPDSKNRNIFIAFFCWGGGFLTLAGIPIASTISLPGLDFFDRIFFIDPAWGWWGLNFGRGHFNSTEGFFHFLFLAGILCILKGNWIMALIASIALSSSHPFTGIEFLAVVMSWLFVENVLVRKNIIPWPFVIGLSFILVFHIFYYLIYLNQFPEHRSLSEQYALNWRLRFFSMIPAYAIVGALATFSLIKWKKLLITTSSYRLFFCWFVMAFTLANHELFMKPMQPLHFTRGYVWTALFLLSLPALHYFFRKKGAKLIRPMLVLLSVLIFSDNFLWVLNNLRSVATTPSEGYITSEQKQLLNIIEQNSGVNTLIIGKDAILPYLSTVFSRAHPWLSHPYTTPFASKKEEAYKNFIDSNAIDTNWRNREVILVFRKSIPKELRRSGLLSFHVQLLANTPSYIIQKGIVPPQ